MVKVADQLSIKLSKVKDEKDQEYELAGSIDCKGIWGTDRRKYLLDLIWLTPRDANYPSEEHSTRVVRRELILTYQRNKSLEFAAEKMKTEPQEAPTSLETPAADASEEVKKKYEEERSNEIRAFRTQ